MTFARTYEARQQLTAAHRAGFVTENDREPDAVWLLDPSKSVRYEVRGGDGSTVYVFDGHLFAYRIDLDGGTPQPIVSAVLTGVLEDVASS